MRHMLRYSLAAALAAMLVAPAGAQTIYPLDRAEILAGSRFDFKVEFPGSPAEADVRVTINGQPAATVLGKAAEYAAKEEGQEHSALWVRGVEIATPGTYKVEAAAGGQTASVTWEVFGTGPRAAKNVILFVGDGMSNAHRVAARILSKGIRQGRYGGNLAMDDMTNMALISTAGTDSIITDSANSMAAYTTGHKSCTNALGVYCARNRNTLAHPRVETITPLVKRKLGLAVGVVTDAEIEDATPAGMVANTRRRSDYNEIVRMFFEAEPEVIMGGGTPNFLPKSQQGSRREDEIDYIARFKEKGYTFVETATDMKTAAADAKTTKLLGLFNPRNIDGALDRRFLKMGTVKRYPDQPDLVDMTKVAIDLLSKNQNGFVLMVEAARIDKYSHSLDWERAVYDTIMLDNAVKAAKEWAGTRNDTLIVVVADHTHPVSIIGTVDDSRPGTRLRDKIGIYNEAGFPNYPAPDAEGYPPSVDVSRRLAFTFGAYPDHCTSGKPFLQGEFVPARPSADNKEQIANEEFCGPTATRMQGNLPLASPSGVHSGEDSLLTAMGPGADQFRGHMENTRVFRVIANALGLAAK